MRRHIRQRKALQIKRTQHPYRGFEAVGYLKYLKRHRWYASELGHIEGFRFVISDT